MASPDPTLSDSAVTVGLATSGTSIGVDKMHTSSISGLSPGTVTLSSTPSTSTADPSPTSSAAAKSASARPALGIGATTALAVGIFLALAIALVIFMTLRHRRRLRAPSALSRMRAGTAKSWARLEDPAPLQMRATNAGDVPEGSPRPKSESILSLNSLHPEDVPVAASPHPHPFAAAQHPLATSSPQLSQSSHTHNVANIPNPFASPPTSRSPSPSEISSKSSAHYPPPSLQINPQSRNVSVVVSNTDSIYSLSDPDPRAQPTPRPQISTETAPLDPFARLRRKSTAKAPQDAHARARELRAMQELILALDDRGNPPSFIDTGAGNSRLSRNEGVVTPGGHSPVSLEQEQQRTVPTDVFRSALGMGERSPRP